MRVPGGRSEYSAECESPSAGPGREQPGERKRSLDIIRNSRLSNAGLYFLEDSQVSHECGW